MRLQKIDRALFSQVSMLEEGRKGTCYISGLDFARLKRILRAKKIEIVHEYLFIKSFCIRATKNEIFSLSSLSVVGYISSVQSASVMLHISKKILGVENSRLSGKGVTVAFIDTGVSPHGDFLLSKNRIVLFKDFVSGKGEPYDDNGHGTFVCGCCSGMGALSSGKYSGVAPQSNIVALKALSGSGEASSERILDAMEWLYDNHKSQGISIVCMSFGSEPIGYGDPIMAGAEALWRDGVIVVAAAGNSGPEKSSIKSPGVSSQIITVGGFDDNRFDGGFDKSFFEIADFSSRGPALRRFKPDLVAPSVDITSCASEGGYAVLSGTSVAAPMVAGLCALLLEKYPHLSPDQTKSVLLKSCTPISFNKNFEGFGYPSLSFLS